LTDVAKPGFEAVANRLLESIKHTLGHSDGGAFAMRV
jgi:hypothetical protein